MSKYIKIALAIVIIVAVSWTGLWFVGRGIAEHRMRVEVSRIEAQGWTLVWKQSQTTGFPFGYRVTMNEVSATRPESGLLLRLPQVIAEADALDPSRIGIVLPERFSAALPIPETDRRGSKRLPPVVTLRGAAKDFKAVVTAPVEDARTIDLTASGLSLTIDQQDYAFKFNLISEGFEGRAEVTPEGASHRLSAATVDLDIRDPGSARGPYSVDLNARAFSSTLSTDLATLAGLATMIYQGERGSMDVAFQADAVEAIIALDSDPSVADSSLALTAGSGSGTLAGRDGIIDLRAKFGDGAWTVKHTTAVAPYRGGVTAKTAELRYNVPMAPSDDHKPGVLRLAFSEVVGDETLWAMIDPEKTLKRDPATLVLDLATTVRVTDRIDQMLPGAPPPYEFSNITVKKAAIEALGASASATGDIEIRQPANRPLGALTVEMSGANAVITDLARAGMLDEEMRATAEAILQVYANPADGPDRWKTNIVFDDAGMLVNGLRVPPEDPS